MRIDWRAVGILAAHLLLGVVWGFTLISAILALL